MPVTFRLHLVVLGGLLSYVLGRLAPFLPLPFGEAAPMLGYPASVLIGAVAKHAPPYHAEFWSALVGLSSALLIANALVWVSFLRLPPERWSTSRRSYSNMASFVVVLSLALPLVVLTESLNDLAQGSDNGLLGTGLAKVLALVSAGVTIFLPVLLAVGEGRLPFRRRADVGEGDSFPG